MTKEAAWKRELKEMIIIASFFFVIFILLLLLKKAQLNDYQLDYYVISTSLIGSLILAKVILIFNLLAVTKKTEHLANIYKLILRSFIYLLGYVIFTFLEHLTKGIITGNTLSQAYEESINHLIIPASISSYVGVFIAFLFFNAFWVIREGIGPAALYDLFFRKRS